MKTHQFSVLVLCFFLLTLTSAQENGDLLESQYLESMPVGTIQQILNSQLGFFAPDAVYDLTVYRIVYQTEDPFGIPVNASGSIAFPSSDVQAFPMVSYQHGTQVLRDDVSSNYGFDVVNLWLGSMGYIVAYPDYLGFGVSDMLHPYIIAEPTAESIIHFLIACQTFCDQDPNLQFNSQLFLAGYSEGGYATMAAQKMLQDDFPDQFQVTLSAPMAGPYDLTGVMFDRLVSGVPYGQPFYVAYLLLSYIQYYELGALDEFFTPYYADLLPELFDGFHDSWQINPYLPSVPLDILQPEVADDLINNPEHPMRLAMAENDLYDWTPMVPTYMFHGLGDELVPSENSQVAYDSFVANDAPDVHLELYPAVLGGHAAVSIYCLVGGLDLINAHQVINTRGDVNEDGGLDVLDIVSIVNMILATTEEYNSYEFWAADYNMDGVVDILDVVSVLGPILGED